jgi:hypothetical protein
MSSTARLPPIELPFGASVLRWRGWRVVGLVAFVTAAVSYFGLRLSRGATTLIFAQPALESALLGSMVLMIAVTLVAFARRCLR